jgi:hypothetical protein
MKEESKRTDGGERERDKERETAQSDGLEVLNYGLVLNAR